MTQIEPDEVPFRRRARPGFLLFPHLNSITPSTCRTDKLEIMVDGEIRHEGGGHLVDTLGLMSTDDVGSPETRVLNAPSGAGRNYLHVKRRAWLFGGQLELRSAGAGIRRVCLKLTLNPTRFAEHVRRVFAPHSIGDLEQIPLPDLLRHRLEVTSAIADETLDEQDNLLGPSPWATEVTRHWPRFVAFYASSVVRLIETDFNQRSACVNAYASSPAALRLCSPSETCPSIGYIEQYVELQVDDMLSVFPVFEQAIREAGMTVDVTTRSYVEYVSGRTHSARWMSTWLREGENLKVYSKTPNRLRVEVEYHGRSTGNDAHTISALVNDDNWRGRHTFSDKISALRADATDRLTRLVHRASVPTLPSTVTPVAALKSLILELRRTKKPAQHIEAFLSELFDHGSVGGGKGSPARAVAEAMKERSLFADARIHMRGKHRRFAPIPALQQAVDALRALADEDRT